MHDASVFEPSAAGVVRVDPSGSLKTKVAQNVSATADKSPPSSAGSVGLAAAAGGICTLTSFVLHDAELALVLLPLSPHDTVVIASTALTRHPTNFV
jgi:hypothetical protein